MVKTKWLKWLLVLTLLIGLLPAAVAFAEDGVTPEVQGLVQEGTDSAKSPDSPGEGNFKFYGTVESLPPGGWYGTWTVSGRFVNVDIYTRIKGMPAVGSYVEVKGWLQADGSVNATKIEVKNGTGGGGRFKFYGTVQQMPPAGLIGTWLVDGRVVQVSPTTWVDQRRGPAVVGAFVEVEGWLQADGSVNATKIEVKNGTGGGGGGGYIKFYGTVQVLPAGGWYGDWVVVSGTTATTVHVAPTTFIKQKRGMVRLGAYVEVKGYTQPDGSVNAIQIEVKG